MVIGHKRKELIELRGLLLSKPMIVVGTKQGELINVIGNFKSFTSKYLINKSGYLGHYASVVKLMSPQNILNRGFALIKKNGALITGGETLNIGDVLEIQMKDSLIKTKIESKLNNGNTE
jgi:exodeoxyribonuclease VII large subunit